MAVTVAASCFDTLLVAALNVPFVRPWGTVTVAGRVTALLLLDNVTTIPPLADGPVKVTVPAAVPPPVTVVGLKATEASVGAAILSVADSAPPPNVAVTVAAEFACTGTVVTANIVVACPPGTVTVDGTPTEPTLLDKLMTHPPVGAKALRVTVP